MMAYRVKLIVYDYWGRSVIRWVPKADQTFDDFRYPIPALGLRVSRNVDCLTGSQMSCHSVVGRILGLLCFRLNSDSWKGHHWMDLVFENGHLICLETLFQWNLSGSMGFYRFRCSEFRLIPRQQARMAGSCWAY